MAKAQPVSLPFSATDKANMALHTPSFGFPINQPYKLCVQVDEEIVPGRSPEDTRNKRFTTLWLSHAHPLFSAAGVVYILRPFSIHTGGIPLRRFVSNDNITFVAHAHGEPLYAEQYEVIWHFMRFARGISSPAINDTAILTLDESEKVPTRVVSEDDIDKVQYIGWKPEHFKKFFDEYVRFSHLQTQDCVRQYDAASWPGLQTPTWISSAIMNTLVRAARSHRKRRRQEILWEDGLTDADRASKRARGSVGKTFLNQSLSGSSEEDDSASAGAVGKGQGRELELEREQGSGSDADVEDEGDDDEEADDEEVDDDE
jgi:hypothetical protein